MGFWIAAIAAALATAIWIARPLALSRRTSKPRAAFDEQVFRDQLAEVDRDLDRGVLSEEEARGARIEISRRLLAAAAEREAAADHDPAPRRWSTALAVAVLAGAPLAGVALYSGLGQPGLPDQPAAQRAEARPGQELAESRTPPPPAPPAEAAELVGLIAQLEERLAVGDPDPQGVFLLARSLSRVGRHADSWRAYQRLITIEGGDAPAPVFAAMGEGMVLAAGGYVSPEAERVFEAALEREPSNPIARYYLGSAHAQTARVETAMQIWAGLIAESPADAPWVSSTQAQMAELAEFSGVPAPDVRPLPPLQDPRAAMLEAARALDQRLAAEGGSARDWAQAARSYVALGMEAEAADVAARARAALSGQPLDAFEAAMAEAPPAPPGPDAAAVAAAQEMTPEDRAAMIRGMVEQLGERLRAEGGEAEDWARLIQSRGVLGDAEGAEDAYRRAIAAHGADPVARAFLKEQALLAGASVE